MDEKRLVKASKYLSRHLRHQPEAIGLTLEPGGWVAWMRCWRPCGATASRSRARTWRRSSPTTTNSDSPLTKPASVSAPARAIACQSTSSLRRYLRPIRSITAQARPLIDAILREGLRKMRRSHVHLSSEISPPPSRWAADTARQPCLLVNAAAMARDGYQFYLSDNGVWLTESVPPRIVSRARRILSPLGPGATQAPAPLQ